MEREEREFAEIITDRSVKIHIEVSATIGRPVKITMRRHMEPPVWLLIVGLIHCAPRSSVAAPFENNTTHVGSQNRPRVFSPRMDYDEWTPLGRGNPLRNDPTYDYVPPVLDRVHYWLDSQTTEPSPKRDILLLGATAKKTSAKLPDHYQKFANRQKFPNNQETQSEAVKLRTTSFRNDVSDYRNPNRMPSVPGSYYPNSYYGQQSKPYTMMLPPPLLSNPLNDHQHLGYDQPSKDHGYEDSYQFSTQTEKGLLPSDQQLYDYPPKTYSQSHLPPQSPRIPYPQATAKPTPKVTLVSHIETLKSHSPSLGSQNPRHESTTSTVSFEKSDLVYQSSQTLSSGWLANDRGPVIKTPSNDRENYYQDFDHLASGSSNHDVVIGQNANIIVQGESCGNDEVVVGQKEEAPSVPNSNEPALGAAVIAQTEDRPKDIGELGSASSMHIVLANSPPPATTDGPVTIVMPTNYSAKNEEAVTRKEEAPRDPIRSQEPVALGTEEPAQDVKNFENATRPPGMLAFSGDPPSPSPMRNSIAHQQSAISRFPPSGVFGTSPSLHMMHQPLAPVRPPQVMMHFGPKPHSGMVMGLRPPAPPAIGHGQINMADLFRGQQAGVMTMEEQIQSQRPYQHRITQPSGPTMTSARPSWMMTSMGVNVVEEDQALGHTGQELSEVAQTGHGPSESVQTTFRPTPTGTSVADSVSSVKDTNVMDKMQSQLAILLRNEDTKGKTTHPATTSTTSSPLPVTTVFSLTTDQIFSHYKQPAKPIRGPMYLIIQGHSKVKTYKPTAENHSNSMEGNEILDNTTSRPISDFDKFVNDNTRRTEKLVATKRTEEKRPEHPSGPDSLLSLLESGFSSFTMPPLSDLEENLNSTVK